MSVMSPSLVKNPEKLAIICDILERYFISVPVVFFAQGVVGNLGILQYTMSFAIS